MCAGEGEPGNSLEFGTNPVEEQRSQMAQQNVRTCASESSGAKPFPLRQARTQRKTRGWAAQ